MVKVTYLKTGNSVEVKINDRGPHVKNRIIDVSGAAAEKLGMKDDGIGDVRVEVLN
jgi:rare lipoprotein A